MSVPDEDLYTQLMLTDPSIAKLTEAAVGKALEGFALTPQPDMAWLARAIQGALLYTLGNASDAPERQSNKKTKAELKKLASRASKLRLAIQQRSGAADSELFEYARSQWDGGGGADVLGVTIGEPSLYRAFQAAQAQLDWLPDFLLLAANGVKPQSGPWQTSERREKRIERAQCLSPIYEMAFGAAPTVNTWPGQNGGPWPDFYQRIVALAFGELLTPDAEGVLDEARRRDKNERVIFEPGIIPDYRP